MPGLVLVVAATNTAAKVLKPPFSFYNPFAVRDGPRSFSCFRRSWLWFLFWSVSALVLVLVSVLVSVFIFTFGVVPGFVLGYALVSSSVSIFGNTAPLYVGCMWQYPRRVCQY